MDVLTLWLWLFHAECCAEQAINEKDSGHTINFAPWVWRSRKEIMGTVRENDFFSLKSSDSIKLINCTCLVASIKSINSRL